VVRVASADALQVALGVEPADAPHLAIGKRVVLTPLQPGAIAVTTTIAAVDLRIDPQTHQATAWARLPAGAGIPVGAALRGRIVLATHDNAIAVPRRAVLYDGDARSVFVAEGNKARRREVKAGLDQDDAVEILSGLAAGDPVIVSGSYELDDGMTIRTADKATVSSPAAASKP
jgi:RND family efflux transporter MFP subunit